MGEEAEKEAPTKSKTGSTRSASAEQDCSTTSPASHKQHKIRNERRHGVGVDEEDDDRVHGDGDGDIIRRKGNRFRRLRGAGGMSASSSPFPASFIVHHKRYILPTLLLVAAVAVGAAASAEERGMPGEPRHRQQQQRQPLEVAELPVQAQHHHHRRQRQRQQYAQSSSSSREPSRDLNEVSRYRDFYSNSTAPDDGAFRRRDANLTIGNGSSLYLRSRGIQSLGSEFPSSVFTLLSVLRIVNLYVVPNFPPVPCNGITIPAKDRRPHFHIRSLIRAGVGRKEVMKEEGVYITLRLLTKIIS